MTIIHDVRDTWRALVRSPYFTIPVVLSLAFAIGVNVAAFSIINALVLRPLPVRDPHQLFHVTYAGETGTSDGGSDQPTRPGDPFSKSSGSRGRVAPGFALMP